MRGQRITIDMCLWGIFQFYRINLNRSDSIRPNGERWFGYSEVFDIVI